MSSRASFGAVLGIRGGLTRRRRDPQPRVPAGTRCPRQSTAGSGSHQSAPRSTGRRSAPPAQAALNRLSRHSHPFPHPAHTDHAAVGRQDNASGLPPGSGSRTQTHSASAPRIMPKTPWRAPVRVRGPADSSVFAPLVSGSPRTPRSSVSRPGCGGLIARQGLTQQPGSSTVGRRVSGRRLPASVTVQSVRRSQAGTLAITAKWARRGPAPQRTCPRRKYRWPGRPPFPRSPSPRLPQRRSRRPRSTAATGWCHRPLPSAG